MTDLQSLQQLRERVSKLEGPDRGVDGFFARDVLGWTPEFGLDGDELVNWPDVGGHWNYQNEDTSFDEPDSYTASIDAALALVERVLPGNRGMILETPGQTGATAQFHGKGMPDESFARTLPLAILLALLDALISEKTKAEEPA